eukprot:TRINITY_DN23872_c0_g1_i1.p1 TRINITY_DN23872_c0_g1~~TRINITY_DN23872_c0_g1_i1.p1  ORF type:complete len:470 (+),score=73.56 TRINITY_DN23872_c0_g1_i1:111-1520(+)
MGEIRGARVASPTAGSNAASAEKLASVIHSYLLNALNAEAPGHAETVMKGYRSSVRRLGKVKGQATADFTSSAAAGVWKRASAGVGSTVDYIDAFDLAVAVLKRILLADSELDVPVLEHAWVEHGGALHFITKQHHCTQVANGNALCRGCGFYFAAGGALRQHAQNATDSRCLDAAAAEYYEKPCQDAAPRNAPEGEKQGESTDATTLSAAPLPARKSLDAGMSAARDGKLDVLQDLVARGTWDPLTSSDTHGNGALHWAAGSGHLHVCRWLVESCGMNPATQTRKHHGRTALHWAARNGNAEVCKWLLGLDDGPKVDTETDLGETPLMLAAWQGHVGTCQLLVEARADVNHLNTSGCTAMHKAARMDGAASSIEMLKFLYQHDVDPLLANSNGHNAMHKAAQHGSPEAVQWLLDTAGCRSRAAFVQDRDRNSPSSLAYAAGHHALASRMRREEDILWLVPAIYVAPDD